MKFRPVPVETAAGKIMGHNIAGPDGKRLYRKGKLVTQEDVQKLIGLGKTSIYVAELEVGDVTEDQAALRIARAVTNSGLHLSGPSAGRVIYFPPREAQMDAQGDPGTLLPGGAEDGTGGCPSGFIHEKW